MSHLVGEARGDDWASCTPADSPSAVGSTCAREVAFRPDRSGGGGRGGGADGAGYFDGWGALHLIFGLAPR